MSDRFTWFHSGQFGAPQMNGAAGSNGQMLQVLDACLINGFNPQTVITATKTATSVTLTFGVSHGYEVGQLILVSGATDAALNGNHRIISKTTNTVTIDAVGASATTGTITTKVAPLGWQSIFGATDPLKRAYRSNSMQSSKTVLYLDMSLPTSHGYNSANPAKRAMIDMCENMTTLGTQINSYTSAFNNRPAVINGKMFWYQCRSYNKTLAVNESLNRTWVVVGNGRVFYLFNAWSSYFNYDRNARDTFAFGDFDAIDGSTTNANCGWLGAIDSNDASDIFWSKVGATIGGSAPTTTNAVGFMIKSSDGSGNLSPLKFSIDGSNAPVELNSGYVNKVADFPNPATQSVVGLPIYALTSQHLRARISGLLYIPQNMGGNVADYDKLADNNNLLVSVDTNGQEVSGFFAIDLGD